MLHKSVERSSSATNSFYRVKPPINVYMQNRFNAEQRTNDFGGGRYASTTLEMMQIIYGKPVAKAVPCILSPFLKLYQRTTLSLFQCGMIDKQPFAHAGGFCVHRDDVLVRILTHQLVFCESGGVICSAKIR